MGKKQSGTKRSKNAAAPTNPVEFAHPTYWGHRWHDLFAPPPVETEQ